jgi:hypothetical protein
MYSANIADPLAAMMPAVADPATTNVNVKHNVRQLQARRKIDRRIDLAQPPGKFPINRLNLLFF